MLGTVKNSTKNRTHIWGYASLPPVGYLQLIYCCINVPRISNQQHLEPTELTRSLSTQVNHMGRINLEPPQATASKHWSPHNIPIKVWVGVRVECDHNHVFVVFPAAVVDNNVYTGTAKQQ